MDRIPVIQSGLLTLVLLICACKPERELVSGAGAVETDEVRVAPRFGGWVEAIFAWLPATLRVIHMVV